ncbi:DUF1385 domain-containing protein [candidate division KSB1 bacterium]|nr:DUF1385 domain-containing protein [candidate division KSB1 bacterium]
MSENKVNVGGQAVIEGVMMRSPERVAVAVRRSDGKIVLKNNPYISFTKRSKFWNLPIIRGAVVLIESMVLGVKALTFSGDIAADEDIEKKKEKKGWKNLWLGLTVLFSFAVGLLLFFYIPLILTDLLGAKTGFMFNLVDGIIRVIIFLAYLGLITLWKEIRRVFQYHGAEHKSIFTYEDNKDLTIENANSYKPYHPRCGTSFIIMVLLVSIIVFMFLGRPETIADRLIRLAFVPLIGGISYELIKLSDKRKNNPLVKAFIAPGLWMQKITAREPDESMLEVAIVALKGSLGEDFSNDPNVIKME